MNQANKPLLIIASIGVLAALVSSFLSLTKLGNTGDADPVLTPLRIISRDIIGLAIAVLLIIIYLWKRDR